MIRPSPAFKIRSLNVGSNIMLTSTNNWMVNWELNTKR